MFFPHVIYGKEKVYLVPVFYNKEDKKFYGLFERRRANNEWALISESFDRFSDYRTDRSLLISNFLEGMFGVGIFRNLFKDAQLDEGHLVPVTVRAQLCYLIPIFNFIPEATLTGQVKNNEIDGFVWLDLSQIPQQASSVTIRKGSADYTLDLPGQFSNYLNYDSLPTSERPNQIMIAYQRKMEGLPAQYKEGQTTVPLEPTKPQELKPVQPVTEPAVSYPTNVKNEYKFFYDAHDNALNALKRDIEIAKKAGTLNGTIPYGGMWRPALEYALERNGKAAPEIIEVLLQYGVDPNREAIGMNSGQAASNTAPLIYAVMYKHDKRIFELLLQYGANAAVEYNGKPLWGSETRADIKELLREYAQGTKKPVYFIYLTTMLEQLKVLMMQLTRMLGMA